MKVKEVSHAYEQLHTGLPPQRVGVAAAPSGPAVASPPVSTVVVEPGGDGVACAPPPLLQGRSGASDSSGCSVDLDVPQCELSSFFMHEPPDGGRGCIDSSGFISVGDTVVDPAGVLHATVTALYYQSYLDAEVAELSIVRGGAGRVYMALADAAMYVIDDHRPGAGRRLPQDIAHSSVQWFDEAGVNWDFGTS